MKYNSHILKFLVFFILFCIGCILYKKLNVYKEKFDNGEYIDDRELAENLCNDNDFKTIKRYLDVSGDLYLHYTGRWETGSGTQWLDHSNYMFSQVKQAATNINNKYQGLKDDFEPLVHICSEYQHFVAQNSSTNNPDKYRKIRDKYIKEAFNILEIIRNKYSCFGEVKEINFDTLIQKIKQIQGILLKETIDSNSTKQFNKLEREIRNIIDITGQKSWFGATVGDGFPSNLRDDFKTIFFPRKFELPQFYDKPYFQGNNYKVSSGNYKSVVSDIGIPDKSIQSIITGNHQVVVYEDINFGGRQKVFDRGVKIGDLGNKWRSKISSIKIINQNPVLYDACLRESYFKRKGYSKKLNKWINFLKEKKMPVKDTDYNVINDQTKLESPLLSHFRSLKIVSAGTQNADQEQINLPNFDIKDKGGFNLFRAVVISPNIPQVSTSFSIKDSCLKEKSGIPLELGTTPLVLNNFARSSSREADKDRYDSSGYFGEPQLFIITNKNDDGKNLNGEYKKYYLSNSGNTTRLQENNRYNNAYNTKSNNPKALYHIRAYNPNTGKFDYALDVNSSGNLQPGKLNKTLQTSLYVYKEKDTGYILENYGYRGIGQTAGNPHYLKHFFDNSGRETQELVINENDATVFTFSELTA